MQIYLLRIESPINPHVKDVYFFSNREDAQKSYDFSFGRDAYPPKYNIDEVHLSLTWMELTKYRDKKLLK